MGRILTHTIEDTPAAARPLSAEMTQFSPTGRLLNMHAQMAHAPAVLEAYVPIRRATARHRTLDQRDRAALMLLAAAADASPYARAIISALARRAGWREDQAQAPLVGRDTGEDKLGTLAAVAREAAANSGPGDVDAEYQRIVGLGVDWVTPPTTQPWGNRTMIFRDPEGTLINVCSPARAATG